MSVHIIPTIPEPQTFLTVFQAGASCISIENQIILERISNLKLF